ncbi:MAG TPA: DUF4190 domain-containing protein [Ignavibacteria bacterium]|nr:DUF4190 domain-containing protein [Ignavibacteria bacterium]
MKRNIIYNQDFGAPPPPPPPGSSAPPPPPSMGSGGPSGSAGTNSIIALVAGILSWFFCPFILGIVAWIMGKGELGKIDRGESAEAGRTMAKIGMWLGIINVIVCVLVGLLYLVIILFAMISSSM